MIIVGTGSSKAPREVLSVMTKIGERVREAGGWVRTGHAKGPEEAFELGARECAIVYLPWKNFNKDIPLYTEFVCSLESVGLAAHKAAMHSVYKYHPSYRGLGDIKKKMLARSYFQVLGANSQPADAIVCWPERLKGGRPKGVAAQTIRIAEDYGIPVINMAEDYYSGLDFDGIWTALTRACGDRECLANNVGKASKISMITNACAAGN